MVRRMQLWKTCAASCRTKSSKRPLPVKYSHILEPGQEGLALLVGVLPRLAAGAAGLLEGGLGVHWAVEAEDVGRVGMVHDLRVMG